MWTMFLSTDVLANELRLDRDGFFLLGPLLYASASNTGVKPEYVALALFAGYCRTE